MFRQWVIQLVRQRHQSMCLFLTVAPYNGQLCPKAGQGCDPTTNICTLTSSAVSQFVVGTKVKLTAITNKDSSGQPVVDFAYWNGDCNSGNTSCTVTMNGNKTISATFFKTPQMTITPVGVGNTTVLVQSVGERVAKTVATCSNLTSPPTGSRSLPCTINVPRRSKLRLSATDASDSATRWWAGCNSVSRVGTGLACAITLDDDRDVRVSTDKIKTLTIAATANSTGKGIIRVQTRLKTTVCNSLPCQVTVRAGTTVVLVPLPGRGSTAGVWTGCTGTSGSNGTGVCTISGAESTPTINFAVIPPPSH